MGGEKLGRDQEWCRPTQDRAAKLHVGDVVEMRDGHIGEVAMIGADGGLLVRCEAWYRPDELNKLYHREVRYDTR